MKDFLTNLATKALKLGALAAAAMGIYILASGYLGNDTTRNQDLSNTSVMIVRSDERSGGSGVVLKSTPSKSYILTNSHVCGVIENGGLVIRNGKKSAVVTYKRSDRHDLCLITVASDMGVNTPIAKAAPALGSPSIAVGHPRLLPTVITRGHFSDRQVIEIMTGVRQCKQEDVDQDPDNIILCMFLGGIPQITRYETQLSTTLISPGSSGSPVFNSSGEVSGLVFAGGGDPSYAFIVPFESVANFVNDEAKDMDEFLANNTYEINATMLKGGQRGFNGELQERMNKMCADAKAKSTEAAKRVCGIYGRNLLWNQ